MTQRLTALRAGALLSAVLLARPLPAQGRVVDLLLRNGALVDGTGAAERRADVGVQGDRIVFVGDASRAGVTARRTIDASGLIVAPGFIDPHTHTLGDLSNPERRGNAAYLMQGVTTVITNNDGGGTLDIGKTFDAWKRDGIGTNAALYVPQGSVRRSVMGMSAAAPTPAQMDSMRAIVARGMAEGALGMSTGLYYAPGSYATTDEVIALSRVASQQGGIYDSHMRDESSYTIGLVGSINETLRIGREARIPVHISHIKALGADVWGQSDTVIALIKAARAAGMNVTADQYPYLASGTSVGASLLPRWAEAGGRDSLRARIGDAAIKPKLVAEMERNLVRRGGAPSLLITSTRDTTIRGKTLAQVAEARHEAPIAAALEIILAGDAGVASFNMKDADLNKFMVQPWVMTGSDGSDGHPRKYGTFPRKLRQYVYQDHLLTLPQAIHASSQLTAQTLQLQDRGVIAEGKFADVIVFDPKTIADKATYVSPEVLAEGMRYVLVNGQLAVNEGKYTGALAGRPLRHSASGTSSAKTPNQPDYAAHVEVRRTTNGVPHIKADNLGAAEYALAYVQSEDYGARVPLDLLRSRGEMGRWFGRDSMERDFSARLAYERAVASYAFVDADTREVYEGFAAGANRYVELHPDEFPAGFDPKFNGYDVLAHDVYLASPAQAARFLARNDPTYRARTRGQPAAVIPTSEGPPPTGAWVDLPDEGSNAWAFAPSRTKSGHAILLRNPHLQWNAGYYEAHVTVPGKLDFYGDFRIGGPFGVIGGFNRDLGFATTNNDPLLDQVYALKVDRDNADHYLLDGTSHPIERTKVRVAYRDGATISSETREVARTPYGPVIYRDSTRIYVLRAGMDGDYRAGEQFLRMMRARTLDQWKDAMRMRARLNSSFTYADRAGNILYVWNATIPSLPQGTGSDTVAIAVDSTSQMWTHYVPFDSLPQLLNPKGGYIQNSNDPPYFTNMRQVLDRTKYPAYFPEPRLGLRSQLAIKLIDTDRKLSLADVLKLKHSYRMLLADRVRDDLVKAVRAAQPAPDVSSAIDMIAKWDKTVAPTSRGGVLFEIWWRRYIAGNRPDSMYALPWSASAPTSTPRGIRVPARAVEAFAWAVQETTKRYGRADVAWGDVHRVRIGNVDVPVGGCNGDIGCFRVLWYKDDPDGKREASGGDGWILAVEFGDQPRAVSVLAYGESPRPDSPYHSDQAAMFAREQVKPVAWSEKDIQRLTIRRYRPGEQP
jgi:acyl-homoserine-lactone acylase